MKKFDTVTTEYDENFRAMQARLADLLPRLNERDRRLALATEAKSWCYGGIAAVQNATGVSQKTIQRGMTELSDDLTERPSDRVRAAEYTAARLAANGSPPTNNCSATDDQAA